MLLNDFFEIKELTSVDGKIAATIHLNAEHKIYSGHFPGNPITPGVVQTQMVKEILEHHFKKSIRMKTMSRCKFLQILNPHETPFVNINIDMIQSEDGIRIGASGDWNSVTYFKFNALYQ